MGHDSNKCLQSSTASSYLNKKKNTSKHTLKSIVNKRGRACQLSFTSPAAGAKQSCLCKLAHRPLPFPQQ